MSAKLVYSEAELATRALVQYAIGLDTPDRSRLESSLADDAVLDLSKFSVFGLAYPPIEGRIAVVEASMQAVGDALDTSHSLSNFHVDVTADGTAAEVVCYAEAQHFGKGAGLVNGAKDFFLVKSRYDAQVAHIEGTWKIRQLRITPMWCQGNPSVLGA